MAIATVATAFQVNKAMPREKYRIKMAVHYPNVETWKYFYNPDGRAARVEDSKGNNTTYEYYPDLVLRKYNDVIKERSFVDTMRLNRQGLVSSITSNNVASIMEKRDFDADKDMSTTTLYNKKGSMTGTIIYTYQNGNLVSSSATATDTSAGNTESNTYQYYTDRPNTIGDDNIGEGFVGRSSKNPVKSSSSQLLHLAPVYYNYNYQYDPQGRISAKATYKTSSGQLVDSAVYTYY